MKSIEETPSADILCCRHWTVLICGFLAGLVAAAFINSLPFDFSGELAEAKRLGIVSKTILNGYPKSRDVLLYATLILLPVTCSFGTWLVWSRGRRPTLAALFLSEPASLPASLTSRRVTALAMVLTFLLITFNVNNFYETEGGWPFLGEEGQYLAWAQVLLDGGDYARDFFAVRGPLVVYPLAWAMKLFGASVLVGRIYTYGLNLIATGILMAILYQTVRSRGIFILSSLLALVIFGGGGDRVDASILRVFLGVVPLLILYRYAGSDRNLPAIAAGAVLGISILFSQEVGLCAVFATGVFLCMQACSTSAYWRQIRQGGYVAFGCCMLLVPALGYFYRLNALGRFFEIMYGFPKLATLGYFAGPFPSFGSVLASPLSSGGYFPYWIIGIYLIAAISFLVLLSLGPGNRDLNFRISLLVFGLFLFRTALGRADESHFYFSSVPAFLLTFLMIDDAVKGLTGDPPKVLKMVRRAVVAALLVSLILLFESSEVLRRNVSSLKTELRRAASKFTVKDMGVALPQLRRGGILYDTATAENLVKIGKSLDLHTREGEYVLFFPNEAAYYFLFNRRVPSRYVLAYFAATSAQRREMVAELEQRRPAYVVYSLDELRIDDIPESIQVPEVLNYLNEKYSVVENLGNILILRRNTI